MTDIESTNEIVPLTDKAVPLSTMSTKIEVNLGTDDQDTVIAKCISYVRLVCCLLMFLSFFAVSSGRSLMHTYWYAVFRYDESYFIGFNNIFEMNIYYSRMEHYAFVRCSNSDDSFKEKLCGDCFSLGVVTTIFVVISMLAIGLSTYLYCMRTITNKPLSGVRKSIYFLDGLFILLMTIAFILMSACVNSVAKGDLVMGPSLIYALSAYLAILFCAAHQYLRDKNVMTYLQRLKSEIFQECENVHA